MKLVEPIAVLDCYATGLGAVEVLKGGNVRLILYVEQTTPEGLTENVIVQKTVMPAISVPDAISLAWAATAGRIVRNMAGFLPIHFH